MYIDNRFLIPFATPIPLVFLARAMFFIGGAEWTNAIASEVILASTFIGCFIGALISSVLFIEKIKVGGFYIGRKSD